MFKKSTQGGVVADDVETIIGPSVKIEGDFKSEGNIVIAGIITGKLSTTKSARIEAHAKIAADIEAHDAVIAGEIQGNIHILAHVEILESAKINGNIKTGSISIQQGASVNGNIVMSRGEQSVPLTTKEERQLDKEHAKEEWLQGHVDV
jgi:cytoskeletal protein CcmA (bactofilin family)